MDFLTAPSPFDLNSSTITTIALFNPLDVKGEERFIKVQDVKYLRYASHYAIPIGSIFLPDYVLSLLDLSKSVKIEFASDLEFSRIDHIYLEPLHCNYIACPNIYCKHIVVKNDTVLLQVNSDFILFKVVGLEQDVGYIDSKTKVETKVAARPSAISQILEDKFFIDFKQTILAISSPTIFIFRGLAARFLPQFIQSFAESVRHVDSLNFDGTEGEGSNEEKVIIFSGFDVICDEDDLLAVFKRAVKLACRGKKVVFMHDTELIEPVQKWIEKQVIALETFDFINVDPLVKHSWMSHLSAKCLPIPPFLLASLSMHDIYNVSQSASPSIDILKAVQLAWGESAEVIDPLSVSWDNIAGYESVLEELKCAVFDYYRYKEAFTKHALKPPKGILLHGPSGCGKTLIARTLAAGAGQITLPVLHLSPLHLYSKYFGETEARLRSVFKQARSSKPCILLIDDVEVLAGNRGLEDQEEGVGVRLLTTLLTELDGLETGNDGVTVVAMTSDLDSVDMAMRRPGRMDKIIHIRMPGEKDIEAIVQFYLKRFRCERIDAAKLSGSFQAKSPAFIHQAFQDAARQAIRSGHPCIRLVDMFIN